MHNVNEPRLLESGRGRRKQGQFQKAGEQEGR